MAKIIKEPKNIEILVNIRYEIKDEGLKQIFQFKATNKKYLDYLFDARFLFKNKIDKMVKDFLLDGYIKRVDSKDEIDIYYEKQEVPKTQIRKIQAYIPPNTGCKYCRKAQEDGLFLFCSEKNKHYTKGGVNRCPIFRSKDELLT